jgi:phage-related minor tail protein
MTSPNGNDIEIRVKARDDTKPGFDSVERRADQAAGAVGDRFSRLKGLMAAGGLAAGAALIGGVVEGLDAGAEAAKTAAQTGMSDPDQVKMLGAVAGKLYTSAFADSIAEGQQAIRSVLGAGFLSEDAGAEEIQRMSEKALTLSKVFDQDLGKSTTAVAQLLRNGLAKNADEAFDLITRGIQQGADKSGDLLDTINEYSTQFRELGIDGPKAMGLIGQALKAGARDSDTVADAIKEFAIRSKDGSDLSRQAFTDLGLDADKTFDIFARGGPNADKAMKTVIDRLKAMKNPVDQDATAVALFGTKAEDLQDSLYALDPTTAVMEMGKLAGATDKAGKAMSDHAKNDLVVMWREWKQKVVDYISSNVIPRLRDLAVFIQDKVVPAIAAMVRWIKENWHWLQPLIVAVVTFMGALKAATVITGAFSSGFDILNKVIGMNPIVRVVAAITALVAWFVTAYQTSETFRNKVNAAVGKVRDIFVGAVDFIKKAWAAIEKFFTETIPGWIKKGWNFIYNAVIGPWVAAYKKIRQMALEAIGGLISAEDRVKLQAGMSNMDIADPGQNTSSYKSKPRAPGSAHGGIASGLRRLHERGDELLKLPSGTTVLTAEQSRSLMAGGGSGQRGGHLTLVVKVPPGPDQDIVSALVRGLSWKVRTEAGGDVNVLLAAA